MVNDISSLIDKNDHWEINAKNVFKRMGVARVGKNTVSTEELVKESINTLNISLVDNVEQQMKRSHIPNHIQLHEDIVYSTKINSDIFSLKETTGNAQVEKNGKSIKSGKNRHALKKNLS